MASTLSYKPLCSSTPSVSFLLNPKFKVLSYEVIIIITIIIIIIIIIFLLLSSTLLMQKTKTLRLQVATVISRWIIKPGLLVLRNFLFCGAWLHPGSTDVMKEYLVHQSHAYLNF